MQSGEWGPEQVHPLLLGASGALSLLAVAGRQVRGIWPPSSNPGRFQARMHVHGDQHRHQRLAEVLPVFLNQSARCVSAVNLTPSHPFACAADPGRQSRLTFRCSPSPFDLWLPREAGLRLSLL